MPDVSTNAEKATSQSAEGGISERSHAARPALDACYGRIGISAVAAAARYQGSAKNPAYAPTSTHWRDQYACETV
jgi:hypothetical protein